MELSVAAAKILDKPHDRLKTGSVFAYNTFDNLNMKLQNSL